MFTPEINDDPWTVPEGCELDLGAEQVSMSTIRWEGLDPDTIEQAIKALIIEKYPEARPIDGRGGDRGRDVRWDSPDGLVIVEIKSFSTRLTPARRREIERSLAQAAKHKPTRWELVLPLDHSPSEETWFDNLRAKYPTFELVWRGVTWLNLAFSTREHLRRLVEDESYELLQRAREFDREREVPATVADVISRMTTLTERSGELSPYWRTDYFTTRNGIGLVYSERHPGDAER